MFFLFFCLSSCRRNRKKKSIPVLPASRRNCSSNFASLMIVLRALKTFHDIQIHPVSQIYCLVGFFCIVNVIHLRKAHCDCHLALCRYASCSSWGALTAKLLTHSQLFDCGSGHLGILLPRHFLTAANMTVGASNTHSRQSKFRG